ncbi:hypothetical protein BRC81_02795 [Halobacteriales archaeon QS_1_68_20]|nr:MAG: hypothetical protein BRC81_02795 [Halobacteriales archaeon QS_1_68_20]
MRRRAYLAITATALAGCTGSDGQSTPQGTETATATPTGSSTPTETDAPTETPGDEPTATPSDESIAADHIDAADGHLQDAVAAFTAPADGDDLTSVDGSVQPDVAGVTDALDAVTDELDAAAEHATEQQQATVESLRHVRAFLAAVASAQADAHDLWSATSDGVPAVVEERFGDLGDLLAQIDDHRTAVGEAVDSLADDADPGATTATDAISESEYAAKRDQFGAEHETAGAVREALESTREGMSDFGKGADYYVDGQLSNAEIEFWSAFGTFQDARDVVPEEPPPDYDALVADLDSFLATVEEVSDLLERSARLGREKVSEDEAQAVLEESDLASDSPSASDLLEWLQNRN